MADGLRIRLGVHNLSDAQITNFRNAYSQMQAISDNRGYQYLAGLHGVPGYYCWHHQQNSPTGPRRELFLPWHRAYLYSWEMAMRDRVPAVTLPWWDWTLRPPRQSVIPQIFGDRTVGNQPNPLYSFRINLPSANPPVVHATRRQPGSINELPTQNDVDSVLANSNWSSFTADLEELHDNVHGWVGGTRGNSIQAPRFDSFRVWRIAEIRGKDFRVASSNGEDVKRA